MGYLKERHGMMMLPGIAKEGQCRECGGSHSPDEPLRVPHELHASADILHVHRPSLLLFFMYYSFMDRTVGAVSRLP